MQTGQAIGRQAQDIEGQGSDRSRIRPWGHNHLVTAGPCQSGACLGDPGEDSASRDATLGEAVADASQHSRLTAKQSRTARYVEHQLIRRVGGGDRCETNRPKRQPFEEGHVAIGISVTENQLGMHGLRIGKRLPDM